MIFPKAKKIAKDLGWYKTKDSVFGLYKGYFFNVSDAGLMSTPQFKFVTATTGSLTQEQKLHLKTEVSTNRKKLKFTTFEISDHGILFKFVENLTFTQLKTVYALLDFLADLFKKLNIPEQNQCHSCGKDQSINYYDLSDTGVILCDTCFSQENQRFYDIEKERISKEKNYLTGFLGALLFSVPGILIWVLCAVYFGRLASGMASVIAIFGILGYDYFKGQHGKPKKYIIVLTNIASIIIANVLTVITLLVKEGLTVTHAIQEFGTNEAVKDFFYQSMIISFILAFFVWIWLLFFNKDSKLIIQPAEKF